MTDKRFYILEKTKVMGDGKYLLRLDRKEDQLVVFEAVGYNRLHAHFSIRKDFEPSDYVIYEEVKAFNCIHGGDKSPTPEGVFTVVSKSTNEYISGYYPEHDKVKFFGYLVIFEDYFIHSDLYDGNVSEEDMRNGKGVPISKGDDHTSGCIRVKQEELDWLVENVTVGTTVVM